MELKKCPECGQRPTYVQSIDGWECYHCGGAFLVVQPPSPADDRLEVGHDRVAPRVKSYVRQAHWEELSRMEEKVRLDGLSPQTVRSLAHRHGLDGLAELVEAQVAWMLRVRLNGGKREARGF